MEGRSIYGNAEWLVGGFRAYIPRLMGKGRLGCAMCFLLCMYVHDNIRRRNSLIFNSLLSKAINISI